MRLHATSQGALLNLWHLLPGYSDMSTFFDDIRSVRPTNLMLIPRISNMCAPAKHVSGY
jgi:hypothetical protein